ncbi:N-glycosylase/DNA lyase [Trichoplax sp. H2]|nr:N-glycosylase/DNA lyase [Trichoplax sp. H2]|eukprot:RDD39929.1 N-glycosylase/DNA lyase [Trichoplax sp. H2]
MAESLFKTWRVIKLPRGELNLSKTLQSGQQFTWRKIARENETATVDGDTQASWRGVIAEMVWTLKQDRNDENLLYMIHGPWKDTKVSSKRKRKAGTDLGRRHVIAKKGAGYQESMDAIESQYQTFDSIIKDYFQLDVNLRQLYAEWSKADSNFAKVATSMTGIRILRQDPVENLFSFICSSNNNISRITGMVGNLCKRYGRKLLNVDGIDYYQFPEIAALAQHDAEKVMRDMGFGYRAKYINESAKILNKKGVAWLYSLRQTPYKECQQQLRQLYGVGAKVADCICLMSLDKPSVVPVDTHVFQISSRYYIPGLRKQKSLTGKAYTEISEYFLKLYGPYAGWAHSVLFTADLKNVT